MLSATAQRLCRRFSIAEIQLATDGFSDARLIGRGGFGKVYKGLIDEGRQTVAVKRLGRFSSQGGDEFSMEIETLSKLRHVNLVSLIGYCNENEEMIIIYEYVFNGTLADHLFKLPSLTWKQRLTICIGAGRALDYLHTGTSIIHRDVKSKNILLDENFRAKVSDFGLAKHLSTSITLSHISASVKGTPGYWDPNYFTTGRITKKSDTYAFGVVLLEVLTGRPALDETLDENEPCMTEWAKAKIQNGKANQIVASNLRDEISADCLKIFVGVAKRCLDHEPKKRPTMAQAVLKLESALELQEKRTDRLSRFLPLGTLWGRAKPSVSHPAPETEHKNNETLDTLPVGVPTIPVEELKLYTLPIDVPAIPLDELKEITDNFSSKCKIGEGSKGSVYHGILKSGEAAAIKRWRGYSNEEFLIQVSLLSKLRHDNVVQLLGYFFDDEWRVLAYEYTPHGSLYEILSVPLGAILDKASGLEGSDGTQPTPTLSWAKRVKTAVEAARALDYIHQKSQIHGDITSRNILMFDNYHTAKIADVGVLEQAADMGLCIPTTFAIGTFGYHAPEYTMSGQLSWKCDVYSFGVVLLELVTGCKPFDNKRPSGQQHLVKLAIPKIWANTVEESVDIRLRLKGGHTLKAVTMMVLIANLCVQEEAGSRPNMSVVAELLQSLLDASMSVSQLLNFKSKATSPSEDQIWLKMMELCALEPRT